MDAHCCMGVSDLLYFSIYILPFQCYDYTHFFSFSIYHHSWQSTCPSRTMSSLPLISREPSKYSYDKSKFHFLNKTFPDPSIQSEFWTITQKASYHTESCPPYIKLHVVNLPFSFLPLIFYKLLHLSYCPLYPKLKISRQKLEDIILDWEKFICTKCSLASQYLRLAGKLIILFVDKLAEIQCLEFCLLGVAGRHVGWEEVGLGGKASYVHGLTWLCT